MKERTLYQCYNCKSEYIIVVIDSDFDRINYCPYCKDSEINEFVIDE